MTDKTNNRIILLGSASIMWSLTSLISGNNQNFEVFIICRILLGIFASACDPPAYALIRDYFPPSFRSKANSIFKFASYLGGALSSLSIIFIKTYGWRDDYIITGIFGIIAGISCIIFLKEPERGKYDDINILSNKNNE